MAITASPGSPRRSVQIILDEAISRDKIIWSQQRLEDALTGLIEEHITHALTGKWTSREKAMAAIEELKARIS